MRSACRANIQRLETALGSVLQGVHFFDWAEDVTARILRGGGAIQVPIELSPGLLEYCRVRRLSFVPNLPERARLEIGSKEFELQVSVKYADNWPWARFFAFHELAHTVLFDARTWPPTGRVPLRPGDPDLEWCCSYLAKAFLMPSNLVSEELKSSSLPHLPSFEAGEFFRTARHFIVPWHLLFERLVEALGRWDVWAMYWKYEPEPERNDRRSTKGSWRLTWQTHPRLVPDDLFIVTSRSTPEGPGKRPKARGRFAAFLDHVVNLPTGEQIRVEESDLVHGNLKEFLLSHNPDAPHWAIPIGSAPSFEAISSLSVPSVLIIASLSRQMEMAS